MLGLTEPFEGLMELGTKEGVHSLGYWSNSVQSICGLCLGIWSQAEETVELL